MAFETPTNIDQNKHTDHPNTAAAAHAESHASHDHITPDDVNEAGDVTSLVDEALESVREQADGVQPSDYAADEIAAMKKEVETIGESVSALTSASGRVVKAEAKSLATTFDSRLRAHPIPYLGLGAVVGYVLGRRF